MNHDPSDEDYYVPQSSAPEIAVCIVCAIAALLLWWFT